MPKLVRHWAAGLQASAYVTLPSVRKHDDAKLVTGPPDGDKMHQSLCPFARTDFTMPKTHPSLDRRIEEQRIWYSTFCVDKSMQQITCHRTVRWRQHASVILAGVHKTTHKHRYDAKTHPSLDCRLEGQFMCYFTSD